MPSITRHTAPVVKATQVVCVGWLLFVLAMALPAHATPPGGGPDAFDEQETLVEGTIPAMPANLPQQVFEYLSVNASGPAAPTLRVVMPVVVRPVPFVPTSFRLFESTSLSVPIYRFLMVLRR